jgi:hypothetical protein
MRLILGEHDITMRPGEVAEFDTRLPHWFGTTGDEPVEILSVHGSHGQRIHVRAAPRHATNNTPPDAGFPSDGRRALRAILPTLRAF